MNVADASGNSLPTTEVREGKPDQPKTGGNAPKKRRFSFRWADWFGAGRGVALLLLFLLILLRALDPGPIELLRLKTFDFYQRLKPREVPPERPVVIIDIDERSLFEVGQFPWARTKVAQLVDNLREYGVAVLGFDIVFAEPDRLNPSNLADSLAENITASGASVSQDELTPLYNLPSNDEILGQAIAKLPTVVGQGGLREKVPGKAPYEGPKPSFGSKGGNPLPYIRAKFPDMAWNVPAIDSMATGRGVFSTNPELDGLIRRIPLVMHVDGTLYPALSMEMLRVATGQKSMLIHTDETAGGIQAVQVGRAFKIPTDFAGRIFVYFSEADWDKYIPAVDVLNKTVKNPERLAGKIAIIGTSALGLLDIKATPVVEQLPGVEVHANIIESVISTYGYQRPQMLERPYIAPGVEWMFMMVVGLSLIILVPVIGARWTLLLLVVVCATLFAGSWYYFSEELQLYDPVYPTLTAIILFLYLTYASYAREEAQRRLVRGQFSRYMSPKLVEELAKNPDKLKLGGEMRDMTLLFCDVRGFTTVSEQFTAEGLTQLINRFLTPMTDIIVDREGTIDKYMGDCIMAFWNAPLDDPQHAHNACDSALTMMERLNPLNEELRLWAEEENRKHVPLNVGIGLNSGIACVGNMGSEQRFDYSVLGDTVNTAARLEGQSKTYGVNIVIGEETANGAQGYAILELDLIQVKGKTEAVRIFGLMGKPDVAEADWFKKLKAKHDALIAAYRSQKWDEARALSKECRTLRQDLFIDGFYDLIDERIDEFEANPPGPDWDGVYIATSK
jgi:adenylate cyclase